MSLENPQSQEPTEITPEQLQKKYYDILQTSVSPENITTFFDDALDEFVEIAESAKVAFQKKNPDATALQGADFEDQAFHEMGLEKLDETLEVVAQKMHTMNEIKKFIQIETTLSDTVFVPPQPGEYGIKRGSGEGMEQKKMLPRLIALLYILEHDLDLPLQEGEEDDDTDEYDVDEKNANEQITLLTNDTIFPNTTMLKATTQKNISIQEGSTLDSMMRKQPYFKVCIASLERIIYLCNEEGNASFIFDTQAIQENNISTKQLDETDKGLFKEMFIQNPTLGRRIIQSKFWRENMLQALTETFNQTKKTKLETVLKPMQSKSDFESKKQYPEKKEGWESASSLFKASGYSSRQAYMRKANEYRVEHPKWFELQQTKFGKFAEYYAPELVRILTLHFEELKQKAREIPEKKLGWESASSLYDTVQFGSSSSFTKKAEEYRAEHPEWFAMQRTENGKIAEFFAPELVAIIKLHFEILKQQYLEIPERRPGWECAHSLEDIIGYSTKESYEKKAEQYRAKHPEWFEMQRYGRTPAEYYAPELVTILKQHFEERKKRYLEIPEKKLGWESANALEKIIEYSVYTSYVSKAEEYRAKHPEWFELQRSKFGGVVEHYAPELVAILKQYFTELKQKHSETPEKKPGWESASSLFDEIRFSSVENYQKKAEEYRSNHPAWFEWQRTENGKIAEFFAPELVAIIKLHFETLKQQRLETPEKKPGWESASSLFSSIGYGNRATITRKAEEYRSEHPTWFEMQRSKFGVITEHYAPELVKLLSEYFMKKKDRKSS